MDTSEQPQRGMSLHTKILLGLVLGAVCGTAINLLAAPRPLFRPEERQLIDAVGGGTAHTAVAVADRPQPHPLVHRLLTWVMDPLGQIYLRMLLMTVVPLVLASLAVGVAKLGDLRSLGRIGAKTMGYFVGSMAIAVVIGLTLVNVVQPGVGLPAGTRAELEKTFSGEARAREKTAEEHGFGVQTFVNIVPRNPIQAMSSWPPDMLGVIFFALLVGIGISYLDPDRGRLILHVLEGVGDLMVFIIGLAMKLAPYGVFALIFSVTARFGFDLLVQLGSYVFVVLLGLGIHMFVAFPILIRTLSGLNPLWFFQRIRAVIITAFSTSSSSATLPTSLRTAEQELGVPAPIAGFVLPLGATMNMNGTALFEGVTVVFLAQVFGVPLGLSGQMIVIVLSVLMAVGAAGVPGGSIPLLVMVLSAVGVPPGGIAIIIGVDRLLDMCRTTLNVVGDITCATFIARSEGYELGKMPPGEPAGQPEHATSDPAG
jgi:DAACS family dicarboxylate/amino acid:cation (Na+ or H+) symporter